VPQADIAPVVKTASVEQAWTAPVVISTVSHQHSDHLCSS